jgi:RpiR family transcriptional regulator, carbohydrate utilization regulator
VSSQTTTDRLLPRIRTQLPSLRDADARVARYVLDHSSEVIFQSVTEVAAAAGTSASTVVRCAQTLGFKGFHGLKLALAREVGTDERIDGGDASSDDVLAAVVGAGAQSIRDVLATVARSEFEAVSVAISRARSVLFVGVGTSAPLCQDAAYRFSVVGIDAHAPADAHVQHVRARLLGAGDVCVALSHTGATRETVAALAAARSGGATTVAVTSHAASPLTEGADRVLLAGSREVSFRLEAMTSRLAHLAVLDALLVAVAARDDDRAQRALALYTEVLSEHRF